MSLGTLFVDLKANTASFVGDLGKASVVAKNAARDISREFEGLGKIASQTFGPFAALNPVVSQLSFAFSQMGRAAADAMGSFGKISSTFGAIGALGAGAAAGLGSVAVGALALAAHSAEAAAKFNELSQSTGVSVEALSGFGFVANQTGVEAQVMTLGLERMSKSAFAAATAPAGATNAYTRLHITLRDAAGQIRSTESIFEDLAARFAAMPDGVTKTALAIEIFGRGGAALIPILNQGSAGIAQMLDVSKKLGSTISGETAAAANKFEQNLGVLKFAVTGVENKLMEDLLPTLTVVSTALVNGLGDPDSALNGWIDKIAELAIKFLALADTVIMVARVVNASVNAIAASFSGPVEEFKNYSQEIWKQADGIGGHFAAAAKQANAAVNLAFAEVSGAPTEKGKRDADAYFNEVHSAYDKNKEFLTKLFTAGTAPDHSMWAPTKRTGGADTTPTKKIGGLGEETDTIAEMVAKLTAEAAAQASLASATDRATASMVLQKAAAESFQKIADTRAELEKKLAGLGDEQAKAKGTPEAPRIQAQIQRIKDLLAELVLDTPQIQALYAQIGGNKFAETAEDEAHKFIQSTDEQTAAVRRMAAAYAESPLAVGKAEEAVKIAPLELNLGVLGQLKDAGAITAAAYDVLAAQIQKAITAVHELTQAEVSEAVNKQGQGIATQIAGLNRLTAAAFGTAAALRGVEVENKVQEFRVTNKLDVNDPQLAKVREQFDAEARAQQASRLATRAAQLDVGVGYSREIEQLEQIKEIYGDNKSVLLAAAAAEVDAQRRAIDQWDAQARAAGSFGERVTAIFDQMQEQGQKFGEHVFDAFSHAVDEVSTQLAKLAVTGKANFKQLFDSLAEELLKAQIQRGFAAIFTGVKPSGASPTDEKLTGSASAPHSVLGTLGGIFGIAQGAQAKNGPTGSAGSPFHVILVGGSNLQSPVPGTVSSPLDESIPGVPNSNSGVLGALPHASGGLFGLFSRLLQPHAAAPPIPAVAGGFPFDLGSLPLTGEGGSGGSGFSGILQSLMRPSGGNGSGGGFGGIVENLAKSFSPKDGNDTGGAFDLLADQGGSGGILSALKGVGGLFAKIFGGFLAGGGDVSPGKAYVVGEKHPEFFIPHQAGQVAPSLRTGGGAGGHTTVVNMHVHGVTDLDSFNRSQGQIMAGFHQQAAIAYARHSS